MAKRSSLELFEHYYQGLIYSLPMKDANFMDHLIKHGLVSIDIRKILEGLSAHKERASYFLDNVIKPKILVGNNTYFDKLLTVMNNSNYDNTKDLAKEIEMEYDSDAKCKFIICTYCMCTIHLCRHHVHCRCS